MTRMKRFRVNSSIRLLAGALLNVVLIVLWRSLSAPVWGDWERASYFHFTAGTVAAAALVVVVPAIWRGTALEIILALLIAAPPMVWLYRVYQFWQEVRWG
jgi:hypothetical protein